MRTSVVEAPTRTAIGQLGGESPNSRPSNLSRSAKRVLGSDAAHADRVGGHLSPPHATKQRDLRVRARGTELPTRRRSPAGAEASRLVTRPRECDTALRGGTRRASGWRRLSRDSGGSSDFGVGANSAAGSMFRIPMTRFHAAAGCAAVVTGPPPDERQLDLVDATSRRFEPRNRLHGRDEVGASGGCVSPAVTSATAAADPMFTRRDLRARSTRQTDNARRLEIRSMARWSCRYRWTSRAVAVVGMPSECSSRPARSTQRTLPLAGRNRDIVSRDERARRALKGHEGRPRMPGRETRGHPRACYDRLSCCLAPARALPREAAHEKAAQREGTSGRHRA